MSVSSIDYLECYRLGAREQQGCLREGEEKYSVVSMLLPTLQRQTHNCLHLPAGLNTVKFRGFRTFFCALGDVSSVDIEAAGGGLWTYHLSPIMHWLRSLKATQPVVWRENTHLVRVEGLGNS